MKNVRLFETNDEFMSAYTGSEYLEPWVSYTINGGRVNYNKDKYFTMPFTIEALGDGNFTWELDQSVSVLYSKNGGEWLTMNNETTIPVVSGDTIAFKGTNTSYEGMFFGQSAPAYNLYGNIMSITDGDSFLQASTLARHAFQELFTNTRIVSAENLILPVTTLAEECYSDMFASCTGLTTAPELPATTLASYCYAQMFSDCTSLTSAPALPVTTLARGCYGNMFYGCTSLTTAPALPATTLAVGCYESMFNGCTSLTTAPELPATSLDNNCYYRMFTGCTSLTGITCLATDISASNCTTNWVAGVASSGTFTKAASMSSWTTGSGGIPENWTIVNAS